MEAYTIKRLCVLRPTPTGRQLALLFCDSVMHTRLSKTRQRLAITATLSFLLCRSAAAFLVCKKTRLRYAYFTYTRVHIFIAALAIKRCYRKFRLKKKPRRNTTFAY